MSGVELSWATEDKNKMKGENLLIFSNSNTGLLPYVPFAVFKILVASPVPEVQLTATTKT